MGRRAVFDPTDRDLFNEQRQRFDWSLLQNGTVFRYDTRFQLDSAGSRLADLGYVVHRIDAHDWTSVDDMYDAFAQAMAYPRSYGGSTSAFSDVFADVGTYVFGSDPGTTGTVLAIAGFDTLVNLDHRTAHLILDHFAREARLAGLYAHPMLCLVESVTPDLGPVGGFDVYRGSVWDAEPDPPDPFHPDDLVEFVLQVYVTDPAGYVADLRPVLSGLLTQIGQWQVLEPILISDPTAVSDARRNARHRPQPLPPDARLWQISIGIRGEGDHTELGDQLVHAHHDAGLHFEGMFSRCHATGTEEHERALTRYPELHEGTDR
ncbi:MULTISPECIES: barstar family protein [Rhodococcus]|uniref:barstar family protein n=1 Tax=Rhodococcus TaxID=1827 RepID=UPI001ED8C0D7|nr:MULTISPECIES: barstar family protein [Rhodococcus]